MGVDSPVSINNYCNHVNTITVLVYTGCMPKVFMCIKNLIELKL